MNRWILGTIPALALVAATTAFAQGQQRQEEPRRPAAQESERQAADQGENTRRSGQRSQEQEQAERSRTQRQQAAVRAVPRGWLRIAVDEDGDGRFDRVRYLFAYDFDRASRSSDVRRHDAIQRDMVRRTRGPQMVSGELTDLMTLKLSGFRQDHLVGRVKTKDGRTAKVDLGPKNKYEAFDLREGDRVRVIGVRGRINDRAMLLARHVETDRGTVRIDRPAQLSMKRFDGTLVNMRTARFRGVQEPQVVAKFETDQGRTFTTILGSKSQLSKLDLSQGDDVAILATPSRLQGRPILVARQIRTGETTLAVSPPRIGHTTARQPLENDAQRQQQRQQQRSRDAQGERQPQQGEWQ